MAGVTQRGTLFAQHLNTLIRFSRRGPKESQVTFPPIGSYQTFGLAYRLKILDSTGVFQL